MATLIIASITDRAGKTALAAALAVRMSSENSPAALGKAFKNGSADDPDAAAFAELLPENPAVSGTADDIASHISSAGGDSRFVIVEGSSDVQANLLLAESTDGLILLVARYGEGISVVAKQYGSRLLGVVLNALPRYRGEDVDGRLAADIESAGTRLFGTIPDDRRMLAPKLGVPSPSSVTVNASVTSSLWPLPTPNVCAHSVAPSVIFTVRPLALSQVTRVIFSVTSSYLMVTASWRRVND